MSEFVEALRFSPSLVGWAEAVITDEQVSFTIPGDSILCHSATTTEDVKRSERFRERHGLATFWRAYQAFSSVFESFFTGFEGT